MIIIYTHRYKKHTITTLAKCAETRAYTPPDDPTTGAVKSVTDTARDPAGKIKEVAFCKQTRAFLYHVHLQTATTYPDMEIPLECFLLLALTD